MYAVVHIRDFALQCLTRDDPDLRARPLALQEGKARQSIVTQMTASAEAQQVRLGMTPAQAVARCPDLATLSRNPELERQGRALLLRRLDSLSPSVEATDEEHYTVDLRGVDAGLRRIECSRVVEELAAEQITARIGIARHQKIAYHASAMADPVVEVEDREAFLARLPLHTASLSARLREILRCWGIQTLGQFAALKRDAVGKRLGTEGGRLWDDLNERSGYTLNSIQSEITFEERVELEYEIETLAPLLDFLKRFLEQLELQLTEQGMVAQHLHLVLKLGRDGLYQRSFKVPEPTAEAHRLLRMLETHLESVRTDKAITGIHLKIIPTPRAVRQQGLFETSVKNPHRFANTLARLVAIVGSEDIGNPRAEETHRADAHTLGPLSNCIPTLPSPPPPGGVGLPLQRLRPAPPAEVRFKDGAPSFITSSEAVGTVRGARGPFHYSGDWWDPGQSWERVEWDIALRPGALLRLVFSEGAWRIEGWYG